MIVFLHSFYHSNEFAREKDARKSVAVTFDFVDKDGCGFDSSSHFGYITCAPDIVQWIIFVPHCI
jgi:hypothetical protein